MLRLSKPHGFTTDSDVSLAASYFNTSDILSAWINLGKDESDLVSFYRIAFGEFVKC